MEPVYTDAQAAAIQTLTAVGNSRMGVPTHALYRPPDFNSFPCMKGLAVIASSLAPDYPEWRADGDRQWPIAASAAVK